MVFSIAMLVITRGYARTQEEELPRLGNSTDLRLGVATRGDAQDFLGRSMRFSHEYLSKVQSEKDFKSMPI